MQDVLNVLPSATGEKIVLKNDISFEGNAFSAVCPLFSGILDGQGYKIRSINMQKPFFTSITAEGTIRNIEIHASMANHWAAAIATNASGIIENVFVNATERGINNVSTAGLFSYFRADIPLVMNNVVVMYQGSREDANGGSAICAHWNGISGENFANFTWNNVYAVSNRGLIQESDYDKGTTNVMTKIQRVEESKLIRLVNDGTFSDELELFLRKNMPTYTVETGKYQKDGTVMEGHAPSFTAQINGETTAISTIMDGSTVVKAENSETLSVDSLAKGVRTWDVTYVSGNSYTVKVNLVNAILKTQSDVLTILPKAYTDYIVLGNNIDMTGAANYTNGGGMFFGIFDGCGYAINNLKLSKPLFNNMAKPSASEHVVVKNIALTGVTISSNVVAVIAENGQGVFENVFIQATATAAQNAGMFRYMYGYNDTFEYEMSNVAIVFNNSRYTDDEANDSAAIAGMWNGHTEENFDFSNVFVLSDCKMMDGQRGSTSHGANTQLASDEGISDIATRVDDSTALKAKTKATGVYGSFLADFITSYVTE